MLQETIHAASVHVKDQIKLKFSYASNGMNLKYDIGAVLAFPLLPLLYYQGKRIKAKIPNLPEASGCVGECRLAGTSGGKTLRLLTLGESTIAGVGVRTHEEGFSGTLAREISRLFKTHVRWRVYARSGYTANMVTKKILPKIEEKRADLIVIGLGGNDAFTLNSPKQWRTDICNLISALQEMFPDAFIVFCNMPPIRAFPALTPLIRWIVGNLVEILGEELHNITQDLNGVYAYNRKITLKDWITRLEVSAAESEFFSDGVHPSKLTYQTWARDLAEEIRSGQKTQQGLKHFL